MSFETELAGTLDFGEHCFDTDHKEHDTDLIHRNLGT